MGVWRPLDLGEGHSRLWAPPLIIKSKGKSVWERDW